MEALAGFPAAAPCHSRMPGDICPTQGLTPAADRLLERCLGLDTRSARWLTLPGCAFDREGEIWPQDDSDLNAGPAVVLGELPTAGLTAAPGSRPRA